MFFLYASQYLILLEFLKVDGGDVENLTNWKAKQLLKNAVFGTPAPFQMNMLYYKNAVFGTPAPFQMNML
jgi:hypothetical protein